MQTVLRRCVRAACPNMNAKADTKRGPMARIVSDALRYWEWRRLAYNGSLTLGALGWIILTWPHFRPGLIFAVPEPLVSSRFSPILATASFIWRIFPRNVGQFDRCGSAGAGAYLHRARFSRWRSKCIGSRMRFIRADAVIWPSKFTTPDPFICGLMLF
jgi:hypothetical protein